MDTRKKCLYLRVHVCARPIKVTYIGVPAGIRHFCTVEKTSFKNAGK